VADPSRPNAPLLTETYSAVKINPAISPALFRFEPPKGAVAINPNDPPPPYDARIKLGAAPIPLTGVDLSGKPVSLAQYKGKVLLLDFWATWCGPCIHELPNVISAYGKYHAQGFDVVGITLDKQNDKVKVQEFVTKSQMPWRQIFDGKYWSSANATAYGVRAIPFALLIGRDGKVAAISPRGPDLGPAIEAALKRR
jgi:thiol-disulfide isomerase/thioredoxin